MKRQQRASSAIPSAASSRAHSLVGDHYLSGSAMMEHSINDAPLAISAARKPSATPTLESPDQLNGTNHDGDDNDDELFPVRVRFKRVTILLVSLVFVGIVIKLMKECSGNGILIDNFKSEDKDSDARKELTDKYNSYSASVVAFLIKPLEIYSGMMLAVTFLCFAGRFGTSAKFSDHYGRVLLVATAGAGYLLSNGFNAINVQLLYEPTDSIITSWDLSYAAYGTTTGLETPLTEYSGPTRVPFMRASNVSFLEESPLNQLTNTILHNAVASIELNASPQCKTNPISATYEARRAGAVVSYGFPSRDWHPQALTNALPATRSLTIAIADNATQSLKVLENSSYPGSDTAGSGVSGVSEPVLPMNTSVAVQLLVQGIAMTQLLLPWWETSFLDDLATNKIKSTYTPTAVASDDITTGAKTALMSELLFTTSAMSNSTELLTQAKQLLFNLFSKAANVSASEVNATFSRHSQVVTGVQFDSLTLEIPLRRSHLSRECYYNAADQQYAYRSNTSASQDGNYYYDLNLDTDCSRDACVTSQSEYALSGEEMFIEPQIHALAACVNADGGDDPMLNFQYRNESSNVGSLLNVKSSFSCSSNSKRAMFTVSLGKRIQGDDMTTRELKDRTKDNPHVLRLTNARKVYSITVTRISWTAQDLGDKYNAECLMNENLEASDSEASLCMGLWYRLKENEKVRNKVEGQHVVVSSARLPLALLSAYQPDNGQMTLIVDSTRLTPLVSKIVRQSSSGVSTSSGQQQAGSDLVYPRRFKTASWPTASNENTTICSASSEDVIEHTENNHLYMEQTLQPAIAAGFFFLFQDAVALDIMPEEVFSDSSPKEDTNSSSSSNPWDSNIQEGTTSRAIILGFVANSQTIDVYLSSPLPNIIATLVGTGLLLLSSIAIVIVGGRKKERQLQSLMTANSIAELQIDDTKYPSWLLEKTIKPTSVLFADAEEALVVNDPQQKQTQKRFGFGTRSKATELSRFRIQRLVLEHEDENGQQIEFPSADGYADPNNGSVFA